MMSQRFSIRAFREADWPNFLSFAEQHFDGSHPTDRAFNDHWFKRRDCYTIMLLTRQDESLAGVMMLIRVPARMLGRSVDLHWISTILVEEDAQKLGAGGRLLHWAHRSLPLVGSMCGNERSLPMSQALGRDVPGLRMRRFVYIHRPACYDICDPVREKAIHGLRFAARKPNRNEFSAEWRRGFPLDAEELFRHFSAPFAVAVARDQAYLAWRYEDSPFIRYSILEVRRGRRLVGLTVSRFQRTPSGLCNRIVDFAADRACATDIWALALDAAEREGALYSDFFVVGTAQDNSLLQAGFHLADENLEGIPNLLAPVDYRQWSYSFHLGGALARETDAWREPDRVWFTKGDGDRDWATPYVIAQGSG